MFSNSNVSLNILPHEILKEVFQWLSPSDLIQLLKIKNNQIHKNVKETLLREDFILASLHAFSPEQFVKFAQFCQSREQFIKLKNEFNANQAAMPCAKYLAYILIADDIKQINPKILQAKNEEYFEDRLKQVTIEEYAKIARRYYPEAKADLLVKFVYSSYSNQTTHAAIKDYFGDILSFLFRFVLNHLRENDQFVSFDELKINTLIKEHLSSLGASLYDVSKFNIELSNLVCDAKNSIDKYQKQLRTCYCTCAAIGKIISFYQENNFIISPRQIADIIDTTADSDGQTIYFTLAGLSIGFNNSDAPIDAGGINFSNMNLQYCIFKSVNMRNFNCCNSNCSNATFEDLYLLDSEFNKTNLQSTSFKHVKFDKCIIENCKFDEAIIIEDVTLINHEHEVDPSLSAFAKAPNGLKIENLNSPQRVYLPILLKYVQLYIPVAYFSKPTLLINQLNQLQNDYQLTAEDTCRLAINIVRYLEKRGVGPTAIEKTILALLKRCNIFATDNKDKSQYQTSSVLFGGSVSQSQLNSREILENYLTTKELPSSPPKPKEEGQSVFKEKRVPSDKLEPKEDQGPKCSIM